MTWVAMRFNVAGETAYSRAFEAMADEARDLSDPLRSIGQSIISGVSEQFRTEGESGSGQRWHPLNPDYEAWKEQQVGPEPILVFHGTMRAAMISPGAIEVSPHRLVYDPHAPEYAIYHQRGTLEDGGHLPKRKIVDIPMQQRRSWDRIFSSWLGDLRRGPMMGMH